MTLMVSNHTPFSLFFDQLTYHRGLPNVSPNITRWSVE